LVKSKAAAENCIPDSSSTFTEPTLRVAPISKHLIGTIIRHTMSTTRNGSYVLQTNVWQRPAPQELKDALEKYLDVDVGVTQNTETLTGDSFELKPRKDASFCERLFGNPETYLFRSSAYDSHVPAKTLGDTTSPKRTPCADTKIFINADGTIAGSVLSEQKSGVRYRDEQFLCRSSVALPGTKEDWSLWRITPHHVAPEHESDPED